MNDHKGQQQNGQQGNAHAGEASFNFFAKKTEKLTTAIYMITEIIDEREPMRWTIRQEAMNLLSFTEDIIASDLSSRKIVFYKILHAIGRVENLLEMSKTTKIISDMNASIVLKEYHELEERLRAAWPILKDKTQVKIPEGFFFVDKAIQQNSHADLFAYALPPSPATPHVSKPTMSNKNPIGHVSLTPKPQVQKIIPHVPYPQKDNHSDRRKIILDTLKTKVEVSVSEIKAMVPGVSDKTIQRELMSMVEAGLLKRKGDRRWSTYSLPNVSQNSFPASTSQTPQ